MSTVANMLPNEKLKQERQRRGWSREYVAEQIGVADPKTIGRWERGNSFPSAHFLQRLCELFNMFAPDLGLYQERSRYTTSSVQPMSQVGRPYEHSRHVFSARSADREAWQRADAKHVREQNALVEMFKKQGETTVSGRGTGINGERVAQMFELISDQDFLLQVHDGVMVILLPLNQNQVR